MITFAILCLVVIVTIFGFAIEDALRDIAGVLRGIRDRP